MWSERFGEDTLLFSVFKSIRDSNKAVFSFELKGAKKAIETSMKDLQKKEEILEKPTYKIILDEFSNSSINIKILFWYDPKFAKDNDMFLTEINADLIERIKKESDKQKITIPFLHVTLSDRRKKRA